VYTNCQIDWLSVTLPEGNQPRDVFPIGKWHYTGIGSHGYNAQYVETVTGIICQLDSADPSMGCHFTFNGQSLENVRRDWARSDLDLLRRLLARNGTATRCDLALDLHEAKVTPRALKYDLKRGRATSSARVWRWIEGSNGQIEGSTVYVGSPDSDRQLRFYDKRAEMGIVDGQAWVRLELELRRIRANSAFQSCARNGVSETVRGHLGDYLHWRNREYRSALDGPSADPEDIPREDTARQKWLLVQVAVALAQEMILDQTFVERLMLSAKAEVGRIEALRKNKAGAEPA
jgi:hypothetical protein